MKKILTMILFLCPLICSAGVLTPLGNIAYIEEYGSGMRVYGLDLSANPANCSSTALAMPRSADTDIEKNRFNSILLSALVSNRKIRLKISDTECESGYPVYYAIRI